MVDVPVAIPETRPVADPIVAAAIFTEVQIPPPTASLKAVAEPGQTVDIPVIVPALAEGLTVTIIVAADIPQPLVTV
jgi:hypothetical protein